MICSYIDSVCLATTAAELPEIATATHIARRTAAAEAKAAENEESDDP